MAQDQNWVNNAFKAAKDQGWSDARIYQEAQKLNIGNDQLANAVTNFTGNQISGSQLGDYASKQGWAPPPTPTATPTPTQTPNQKPYNIGVIGTEGQAKKGNWSDQEVNHALGTALQRGANANDIYLEANRLGISADQLQRVINQNYKGVSGTAVNDYIKNNGLLSIGQTNNQGYATTPQTGQTGAALKQWFDDGKGTKNLSDIYLEAGRRGLSASEVDRAFGNAAGTTENWIRQMGLAPLQGNTSTGTVPGGTTVVGGGWNNQSGAEFNTGRFGDTQRNVQRPDLVQNQLSGILGRGSPLLDQVEARARMNANNRGLLNSSIGNEAALAAVIQSALPIAQQDAASYFSQGRANQDAANTFGLNQQNQNFQTGRDQQQFQNQMALNQQGFGNQLALNQQGFGFSEALAKLGFQNQSQLQGQQFQQQKDILQATQTYEANQANLNRQWQSEEARLNRQLQASELAARTAQAAQAANVSNANFQAQLAAQERQMSYDMFRNYTSGAVALLTGDMPADSKAALWNIYQSMWTGAPMSNPNQAALSGLPNATGTTPSPTPTGTPTATPAPSTTNPSPTPTSAISFS